MAKELFVYSPYKSKFEEQVSSGKVDASQIGIIAESGELWVKGTYLPIVDLSNKADISKGVIEADGLKDSTDTTFFTPNRGLDPNTTLATQKYVAEATTNFAKDLTGVLEATAEEFTFRPSAGDKSIRDASAVIRRIKGNTVVFNQYAPELSVNNYTIRGDVVTQSDNSLHITSLNPDNRIFIQDRKSITFRGHKWLSIADVKSDEELTIKGMSSVGWTPNERCLVSSFYTSTNNNEWYWGISYKTNVPTYVDIYSFSIFDLTLMFDAGNEPTTIEEFYARIPIGVDINAYNKGKIIPMNAIAIETIGFNAYNGEYAEVIGGQAYYLGGTISTAYFTTEKGGETTEITTDSDGIYTPPANGYIYATGNDICINLSHSGVRNGEYEPYKKNIRLLPEIRKYFPDGMNGDANVWDEINTEKAIKRWGFVDLGSLTWVKDGTGTSGVYRWLGKGIEHLVAKTVTASDIPNIICAKYISSSASNIWATTMPMQVSLDSWGSVLIYDSYYSSSSTTVATFTAHMQGVLLYYELAEPKITPITEAIQLDYEVEDFGTEKALSLASSAPFRADIVYQFNAEGRIRDNGRNIERLESNIQEVERTVTTRLIPSQSADLGLPNKVMTWDGYKTLMSLPIAEDIDHWDLEESKLGTIPTSQQVMEYIKSITDNLTPSQSATLESSNRVMVWNGDYAMTSLPIAANFAEWASGTIPTGQQVMDYISAIKGSLATGLIPKETLTIPASGYDIISPNKVYEITTKASTAYYYDLYLSTTTGVDAAADNEWRIRIDTRNGFSGHIGIEPSGSGYSISWAYPEDVNLGAGTAPTIKADFIYDIQFRMIGKTLLGSYKKYR